MDIRLWIAQTKFLMYPTKMSSQLMEANVLMLPGQSQKHARPNYLCWICNNKWLLKRWSLRKKIRRMRGQVVFWKRPLRKNQSMTWCQSTLATTPWPMTGIQSLSVWIRSLYATKRAVIKFSAKSAVLRTTSRPTRTISPMSVQNVLSDFHSSVTWQGTKVTISVEPGNKDSR